MPTDLYASLRRRRPGATPRGEVALARVAAAGTGAVAIALSLLAPELNVAFLVGPAVAASADLPVLLYSLFCGTSPRAAPSGPSTAG